VTGGSSPLGELVVPRLAVGHEVWALARSEQAARLVERRGAHVVRGTLEDTEAWAGVARSADAVVHLAGMRLVEDLLPHVDPGQPLTVIGSASVRNAAHPKSDELRAAEQRLVLAKRAALVVLRPTMIYGASRDRSVRLLARLVARLPAVPRLVGGGVIQPVLADDVADAVATTLGTSGQLEADLGGPTAVRLGALVAELARLLDRRVVPVPVPVPVLAFLGQLVSQRRTSRGIHALAMLRRDRTVSPAGPEVFGHAPTALSDGLALALARYGQPEGM
jgi:uncharacterized protein YbjT (DUF2867 family)